MNTLIATALLSVADEVLLLAGASLLPKRLEPPRFNHELTKLSKSNQSLIAYYNEKKRGPL